MPMLRLRRVALAYGHRPLLDGADLEIRGGERVCLIGRNGEGKSSLLAIIGGERVPDAGEVWIRPGIRVAHLAQEVTCTGRAPVFDVVAGGLAETGRLVSEYHRAATRLAGSSAAADGRRLAALQHEIEARGGWQLERQVEIVLMHLGLDGAAAMDTLSGGWRRRVMLARALVGEPDALLLDEPTNHLDIDAITWLEDYLADYPGALLFVSHDRAFARRLATRVIELDRGRLTSWRGGYDDYARRKAEQLAAEAERNARLDRELAREEAWIRRGIEARRTRNEGRVRALEALREARRARRDRVGQVLLRLDPAERSGRLVCEAERITHDFGGAPVIRDLSVRIMRGDRVGIIGPNGAGKTTLIKLLLGELAPRQGRIARGTRLRTAYFDQQRERLDPAVSVMDSVADGSRTVTVGGRPRHVAGYLRDFLFPPERLDSPVATLSGGERNRLLLARLFARPANLLVLDEPTNDLDLETLDLLEELVADYPGTLLLVSHDRSFLDHVVTSVLAFEGGGRVREEVGGYSDWQRRRAADGAAAGPAGARSDRPSGPKRRRPDAAKLSYNDQRELERLPGEIESLESEQARLRATVNDAAFYRRPRAEITAALAHLDALARRLETAYDRWETLESRTGSRA